MPVKVKPPAYLYSDCGSTAIPILPAESTVSDLIEQSLFRQRELDKCVELSGKLKAWSEEP